MHTLRPPSTPTPPERAARWALKRCLRAAAELSLCGGGGSSSSGTAAYTRDLFWCARLAAAAAPRLEAELSEALRLYVALSTAAPAPSAVSEAGEAGSSSGSGGGDSSSSSGSTAGEGGQELQQRRRQQLEEAWRVAEALAARLEAELLRAMLRPEPGWLTHHHPPAGEADGSGSGNGRGASAAANGLLAMLGLRPQRRAQPVAAAAAEAGAAAPLLPPVRVPVVAAVPSFEWHDPAQRAAAAAVVMRCLRGDDDDGDGDSGSGCSSSGAQHMWRLDGWAAPGDPPPWYEDDDDDGSSISSSGVRPANGSLSPSPLPPPDPRRLPRHHPVVLRGAAASWPALREWAPEALAALPGLGETLRARLAPSLQFPFVEPALAAALRRARGPAAAPSAEAELPGAELVARLRAGQPMASAPAAAGAGATQTPPSQPPPPPPQPLVYAPREYAYVQAAVPPAEAARALGFGPLLADLSAAAAAEAGGGGAVGGGSTLAPAAAAAEAAAAPAGSALRIAQAPRVWASPAGAVSPAHFDASHSFLVQLQGTKRMLLADPDQLAAAYPYPGTHLLRRRARLNVCAPDYGR